MHEQKDIQKQNRKIKDWFSSDILFNSLYPDSIQSLAQKHWTPLEVAKKAADFLAVSHEVKILDIGSGSGKFCLTAAHYHPNINFYGVEQRKDLVALCNDLKMKLDLENVFFINENVANVDFKEYDHFYFYNSFYENIEGTQKIDNSVTYSEKLYDYYNLCLYKQLNKKPAATRLVTFHSFGNEIPPDYEVVHTDYEDYLKFWIKV
ncbi:MAG TPA: methyltransferase domain-containing protein [Hanamia sp.]